MAKTIYTEKRNGSPCRLTRDDMITLEQMMRRDLGSEKAFFKIKADIADGEVQAESVEDFFQHNLLPDTLTKFYISCSGLSGSNQKGRLHVGFYSSMTPIEVMGEDREWVIGRCESIARFLKERRPWYWRLVQLATPAWFHLLAGLMIIITFVLMLVIDDVVLGIIYWTYISAYFLIQICTWFGILDRTKLCIRPKIKDDVTIQTKNSSISIILAILTIIITIIISLFD